MPGARDPGRGLGRDPGRDGAVPPHGDGAGGGSVLLTLPNLITLARLLAVPAVVWLVIHRRLDLAFLVFLGAGLSDALDGWLARVLDARSALGALLDPVADKALLVSTYLSLAAIGVLPDWLAILVVFRDVLIVGGLALLALLGVRPAIRPRAVSKANTALQILLAAAALGLAGYGLEGGWLLPVLGLLVAATTVLSGALYLRDAARFLPR